jgi:enoyl-CoA hydratase/carnithine racemase
VSAAAELEVEGKVATITLSSDRPVISLTAELVTRLDAALDEVEANPEIGCAILIGTGPTFIVGADVKEMVTMSIAAQLTYNQGLIDLANRLETMACPVLACLNGGTFGGGLEFALACSVRIAAAGAKLGLPEVKLGIVPGAGGLVRLPRTTAPGAALEMILSGRTITAAEAREMGLVDRVAADGTELEQARALAEEIAARGPLAVQLAKRIVRETAGMAVPEAVDEVQRRLGELLVGHDAKEGFAAFIEKRPPRFIGS